MMIGIGKVQLLEADQVVAGRDAGEKYNCHDCDGNAPLAARPQRGRIASPLRHRQCGESHDTYKRPNDVENAVKTHKQNPAYHIIVARPML